MTERKVYHITPHEDGWQVKQEGAQKASNVFPTKEKAVARGKELAKKAPKGQVKIHNLDGQIGTEHTYGSDPKRTPG